MKLKMIRNIKISNIIKRVGAVVIFLVLSNCYDNQGKKKYLPIDKTFMNNAGYKVKIDSLKKIILEREIKNNGLSLQIPKSWKITKNGSQVFATEFTYLSDTGYFRVAQFKSTDYFWNIHNKLLLDIAGIAEISGDTNCLDSLVSKSGDYLLSSQFNLNLGTYERYMTVMYVKKNGIYWQYYLLLPIDGTNKKMGKFLLGQILFNSKYHGSKLINGSQNLDAHHIVCK